MASDMSQRPVRLTLWAGLAATVLVTVVSFLASPVLADHIQMSYPTYGASEVEEGVTVYLVILSVIGGLGVLGWLATLWAARRSAGWARWLATGLLVVAVVLAVTGLTLVDTSGIVGLAPLQGWLQLVPCVVGGAAVVTLWRAR